MPTKTNRFDRFAATCADLASRAGFFAFLVIGIGCWAILGPITGFSDQWHLWINTPTTILTTLLATLLHNEQHRNETAMNKKLDRQAEALAFLLSKSGEQAPADLIRGLRESVEAEKPDSPGSTE